MIYDKSTRIQVLFRGHPIIYKRIATIQSKTTNGFIDQYLISQNGSEICHLYLNPYQKKTSGLPPKGFQISGGNDLGTVIANILDPMDENIKRILWYIDSDIERETAEKMHENGEIFIIIAYDKGRPRTILASKNKWLEAKSAFDRIEAEARTASEETRKILQNANSDDHVSIADSNKAKAGKSFSFNADYTISPARTNNQHAIQTETDTTPKKPSDYKIHNKSGVSWVLVLERFRDGKKIKLVSENISMEIEEFKFAIIIVTAKINGWKGGTGLFDIHGDKGVLRSFSNWQWIESLEAKELAKCYASFLQEQLDSDDSNPDRDRINNAFFALCDDGGFRVDIGPE